jgi:hypothetical protein
MVHELTGRDTCPFWKDNNTTHIWRQMSKDEHGEHSILSAASAVASAGSKWHAVVHDTTSVACRLEVTKGTKAAVGSMLMWRNLLYLQAIQPWSLPLVCAHNCVAGLDLGCAAMSHADNCLTLHEVCSQECDLLWRHVGKQNR